MSIRDLASCTSPAGAVTAVWIYEEARTVVVQHECVHISFFDDDFKQYAQTLSRALAALEQEGEEECERADLRVIPLDRKRR